MISLHQDWKHILTHAWSVRFMGLAFMFTVAEAALPIIQPYCNVPPGVFAVLSGLSAGAGFVTRIIAQKQFIGRYDGDE